ncbi:MAG: [Fe-Fe] hydrogenase large subunit C-terminal domain-containing protein [Bacilli bacterium]
MEYCLSSKTNDCKNCYKCIRGCPTKSISFSSNQAKIIHDECILCGRCYVSCPQGTKVIRDDVRLVKNMIANGEKVIVSLAPSFFAAYRNCGFNNVKEALLKLGFYDVEETAIGATIVKKVYDQMLDENKQDIIISSCCHSINLLLQKHHPKCLPYLANVLSPMLAHGEDIKLRHKDAKVVFIGPCIAKKDESDKNKAYIDVVLTFLELDNMLKEANIEISKQDHDEINNNSKTRLFPTSGGILSSMECRNKNYQYLVIDGMDNVLRALEDIESGKVHHCFIEMSACSGSCINGPALNAKRKALLQDYLYVHQKAGKEDFIVSEKSYEDIRKDFYEINVKKARPSEKEIDRILKEMGKNDKSKELNCGSCGYNTCREKAIAILEGKAVKEMCLPYLMDKAESFSENIVSNTPNGLMVLDEELNIQLMNQSMCKIIGVPDSSFVTGKNVTTILEPDLYAKVLCGLDTIHGKKEYLTEYNKYVEQTIVFDHQFHILIVIMRDITNEEIEKQNKEELLRKSIEITNKVIDKNMRSVQEIASLLGETAAETKVALSSLKDTFKDDIK